MRCPDERTTALSRRASRLAMRGDTAMDRSSCLYIWLATGTKGVKAMAYFNRVIPIPEIVWPAAVLLAAAALGACTVYSRGAVQTQATKPVVSYVYSDDEGLMEAT